MAHLGLDIPDEPISDYTTHEIISTFYLVGRSRSYIGGMTVMPLPIGVREINEVLIAHPVLIEREVLDSCVFALDDVYLTEISKAQKENNTDD